MIIGDSNNHVALESLREILSLSQKTDREIARGITLIEENLIQKKALVSINSNPTSKQTKCVGITGAAGVGKSTLLNKLLQSQNLSKHRIAVIAIDPSSKRTRGAVLGDRIRITESSIFEFVYFRSMATRGAYGGVNKSIESILYFLRNSGFDLIIIETVGVGQNEIEISEYVDLVIHVIDCNTGDEVQLEKAGLMEISDVFFINIRGDSINHQFVSKLKNHVTNSPSTPTSTQRVILGSSLSGKGSDEIWDLIDLIDKDSFLERNK